MSHHHLLILLFLFAGMAFADVLIDDFEGGSPQNRLGWSWYYFSDVKDGGNSEILNAQRLSNGSYSGFKPDTGGYDSFGCATMKFALGDTLPRKDLNAPYDSDEADFANFVGMGTDLSRPGGTVDIRPANGVCFRARSNDSLLIFFELVTSTIDDYLYHRSYFVVSNEWKYFTVTFSDTISFSPPCIVVKDGPRKTPLNLNKVQKMHWQVFGAGYLCLEGKSPAQSNDTGFLSIDDISILGIDSLPRNLTSPVVAPCQSQKPPPQSGNCLINDLLGRRLPYLNETHAACNLYLLKNRPGRQRNISFNSEINHTR